MNEKTCKALRRIARERTVGQVERRLVQNKQQVGPKKGGGFVIGAANDPSSTRGVYRMLKKMARGKGPAPINPVMVKA